MGLFSWFGTKNATPPVCAEAASAPLADAIAGKRRTTAATRAKAASTPLICAIEEEDAALVKKHLEEGGDPNESSSFDTFPLWVACKKKNIEIVRILIDAGADVNYTIADSPLFARTLLGLPLGADLARPYENVLIALVEAGANVNGVWMKGPGGNITLLSLVLILGMSRLAECMLNHGVDLTLDGDGGKRALTTALNATALDNKGLLIRKMVINNHAAAFDSERTCDGMLLWALSANDIELTRHLVNKGAKLDLSRLDGFAADSLSIDEMKERLGSMMVKFAIEEQERHSAPSGG